MRYRRLRALAMAVATIGVAMLGVSSPAFADIMLTITDGASTQTFDSVNNDGPAVFVFSAGSYTGSVDVVLTTYPGSGGQGEISTGVDIGQLTSTTPEAITFQVQVVKFNSATPSSSTNLLWASPNGTPVTVTASASLSAAGDTGGMVTTNTYFTSTSSTTTTGTGASTISANLGNGPTGTSTSVPNPSRTYTLSQTVMLSGLVVGGIGTLSPTFSGTSTINGPQISSVTPEPSSLAIASIGVLGMIGYGLRRRRALGA